MTRENLECFQKITEAPAFREDYKHWIRKKLLVYYGSCGGDLSLDAYLRRIDTEEFSG